MPNGDDFFPVRAQLETQFMSLIDQELGGLLSESFARIVASRDKRRFRNDPRYEDDPQERVYRLIVNLSAAAANNALAIPSDPEQNAEAARRFAEDVLRPEWGDWGRLEEVILEAPRRCRYWPFCWR